MHLLYDSLLLRDGVWTAQRPVNGKLRVEGVAVVGVCNDLNGHYDAKLGGANRKKCPCSPGSAPW